MVGNEKWNYVGGNSDGIDIGSTLIQMSMFIPSIS